MNLPKNNGATELPELPPGFSWHSEPVFHSGENCQAQPESWWCQGVQAPGGLLLWGYGGSAEEARRKAADKAREELSFRQLSSRQQVAHVLTEGRKRGHLYGKEVLFVLEKLFELSGGKEGKE